MIRKFNTYINESDQWYPYRFKTEDEMIAAFGRFWKDDAFTEVGWNVDMNRLLGKDFKKHRYELQLDTMNGDNAIDRLPIGDNRYYDEYGMDWLICWDMLTKNRPNKPSYEPRKVDRTLENKIWYPYRFKTEDEMIAAFGNNWRTNSFDGIGWSDLHWDGTSDMDIYLGKEFPFTEEQLTDKDFTNDVLGRRYEGWIIHWDMLTPNKLTVPSYKPRKIDRTLESHIYYPYRFKTEQEFIDAYGENWRDDICDRGPNWAETGEMDHLYGKVYPFQEHELNSRDNEYPRNNRWDDPNSTHEWLIGWDMLIPNKPKAPSYKPRKIDRTLESIESKKYYNNQLGQLTKWPYRFKTRTELNNTCERTASDGDWICGPYLFVDSMSFLFGTNLECEYPDDADYIETEYRHQHWYVTKQMLVKNGLAAPSYEPRKINREI